MKWNRYKILEWNINQATNKNGMNLIPEFIVKELVKQNPDIVVLTEFCFCKNAKEFLEKVFQQRNYDYFPKTATQNTINGQNEVLIAWRKELFECIPDGLISVETKKNNNNPNCVIIQLREKETGITFVVSGIRITMAKWIDKKLNENEKKKAYQEQANLRRKQMESIYRLLEPYPRVIIAGDFNNYRRGTQLKNWNINELNCSHKEYIVYRPLGQSIYEEEKGNKDFEFAEDHFIAKNCVVKDYMYDRNFMDWDVEKNVYKLGNNFPNWNEIIGFPDHAILRGELWITGELN